MRLTDQLPQPPRTGVAGGGFSPRSGADEPLKLSFKSWFWQRVKRQLLGLAQFLVFIVLPFAAIIGLGHVIEVFLGATALSVYVFTWIAVGVVAIYLIFMYSEYEWGQKP